MKKSTVRYIALLMLVLMVALSAAVPISAAGYLDTSKPVTLTIHFRPEEISAADVRFELFKVADVDEYAELTLTQNFKDLPVDLSAVSDSSVWATVVTEAESCISTNSLKANYSAVSDENGTAVFGNVPVGLYLLRGESFILNHDAYKPQAYLIMLPNRADDGSWEYDVTSIPKFDKSDELIDLNVTKKWVGNANRRPKEITVILYCDDVEYESVTLNADNNWKYTWSALNAKHNWTISEVSVEGFTTTLENDGYSYIITNKAKSSPPGGNLPQTGIIWWYIPLIAAAGILCCLAGLLMMKKHRKSA